MPKSPLPDVCNAPWVRPYRFSGVCPGRAWGLMLAAALVGGILVGAFGYWGGWLTYWLSQFALFATGGLWGTGLLGTGVSAAIIGLVFLFAGLGYPTILGAMAGSAVVWAAQRAQCRRIGAAVAFGLLAGLATWVALALTGLLVQGEVRESSRILDNIPGVPDWVSFAAVGLDALVLTCLAGYSARTLGDTPYCETCGKWYSVSKKTELPLDHAALLVGALAGGSTAGLSAAPVEDADNHIELLFQRCECEGPDALLTADAKWTEAARRGTQKQSGRWFATTLPAPLAHDIEGVLFAG